MSRAATSTIAISRPSLRQRLHISTIADDATQLARQYDLGLELAHFCAAMDLDGPSRAAREAEMERDMLSAQRFVLHAPFCELTPAAVDPLIGRVSRRRYQQSLKLAFSHGVRRVVIHSGFTPGVYFPQWFVQQAPHFWRQLLDEQPPDCQILLENVLDPQPQLLVEVVQAVDDPRLRICFDAAHAAIYSQLPLQQWLEQLGPYLAHVHLHDNDGSSDQHQPLGCGVMDWPWLLERLEALDAPPSYSLETLPAAPSLQWLQQQGYLD